MKIFITPQGLLGRLADYCMMPLMYVLQLSISEKPQRTHRWNNKKLHVSELHHFDNDAMVALAGSSDNTPRWLYGLPIFHMPLLGGWDRYIVLAPTVTQDMWFAGWVAGDVAGVSRIPLSGPVRLLEGQYAAQFFGINEHGEQIRIVKIGEGLIGRAPREHQQIPLL